MSDVGLKMKAEVTEARLATPQRAREVNDLLANIQILI